MTFLEFVLRLLVGNINNPPIIPIPSIMGRGGGAGRWAPSSKFKKEADPNQKKITHFFSKAGEGGSSSPSGAAAPFRPRLRQGTLFSSLTRPTTAPASIDYSDDDGEIEILTPPSPTPAEVIVLASDSEQEGDPVANPDPPLPSPLRAGEEGLAPPPNHVEEEEEDYNVNVEELPHQESDPTTNGGGMSPDSSGDEILSQIDIEEVIRLSQSSGEGSPSRLEGGGYPAEPLSSPLPYPYPSKEKENVVLPGETSSASLPSASPRVSTSNMKPPRVSPKSQVNKFSPVKHLRMKRTSSQASLDGSSSSPSPSAARNGSPDGRRGPKKKLQFDNNNPNRSNSSSPSKRSGVGGGPYYLRNFMSILVEVIGDPFHSHLLNDEDHKTAQAFNCLTLEAQSLYVRLFQRKFDWKPINKLNNNYKELPDDLTQVCSELTDTGFFEKISAANSNLEEVLDTLDLAKLTNLAKKMMISGANKTKDALKEGLLTKVRSQKTLSGTCGSVAMLKSALTELGPAFRVNPQTKTLFSRLFILHSPPHYWEVEQDQASNQLLLILLNTMGQMEYPSYRIQKTVQIYKSRGDLLRFHEVFSMHSNLVAYSESKDYPTVVELVTQALSLFQDLLQDEETLSHDSQLPRYLRIYTAGSALCHTCWMGVDGFQKLKRFAEANQVIKTLLDQSTYLPNYRGRLWERLAINGGHLKESKEDVHNLLEKALRDQYLQDNHKLILSQRLEKIRQSIETAANKTRKVPKKRLPKQPPAKKKRARGRKKYIDDSEEDEDEIEEIPQTSTDDVETQLVVPEEEPLPHVEMLTLQNEIPTRTIIGEKMDKGPGSMGKSSFISRLSSGSNRICSVEQHAIQYYLENEGYTGGIHGEGSTVVTLYGLLFWDVIFDDSIPDSFHNRYQAFPLDFHFDDFYLRRKEKIEEKLELIRNNLSVDDLFGIVEEVWRENENKLSIVSWSLWENNLEGLRSLMRAMGIEMIATICSRLARNNRYYSSGFPDVVVWNDGEGDGERKVLFAEVKGPGDTLSAKQQLWLDFLVGNGIPAEVCHVKAVSNKRIRLNP